MTEKAPRFEKGYIQVYTGDGKGKTTAALGLALRAAGHGFHVYIGQFMKGQDYGELHALAQLPTITIEQYGNPKCIRRQEVTPVHIEQAQQGLERARTAMLSGQYQIVIVDEISIALWFGLLDLEQVLALIDEKPKNVELILTGRRAPEALLERADLVTEMREVKHYYVQGVLARRGIER